MRVLRCSPGELCRGRLGRARLGLGLVGGLGAGREVRAGLGSACGLLRDGRWAPPRSRARVRLPWRGLLQQRLPPGRVRAAAAKAESVVVAQWVEGRKGSRRSKTGLTGREDEKQIEYETEQKTTLPEFFKKIEELRGMVLQIKENVQQIERLHQRLLNEISEEQTAFLQEKLEELKARTRQMQNVVRDDIKTLERKNRGPVPRGDVQIREIQTSNMRKKFMESIQHYSGVESTFNERYRQRVVRQMETVNPGITQEEIESALRDERGLQVFSQALLRSNRHGEARTALREVQERHQDIKQIERTIGELAELFNEMSILVDQQDEPLQIIAQQAEAVHTNIEQGLQHQDKAIENIRAARRKRCYCLGLTILILVAITVVVVIIKCVGGVCKT
ncbi:hypothetical protein PMAC_000902 [Pneumocystis sp. 'macacae']|nr:hypothetical protein PMAC_000902 [Pneumocystis sp. 'macacae']